MATIGDITVAFRSDITELETGVEKVVDTLNELKVLAEEIKDTFGGLEKQRVEIETAVDRTEFDAAKDDLLRKRLIKSFSNEAMSCT